MTSIILFWAERGVRIFRVDNPHTKPVAFWEYLIAGVQREISGRDLPLRSLHPAEDDEGAGQGRLHPELHLLHLADDESGADRVLHRTDADGDARIFPRQSLPEHAGYSAAFICRPAGAPLFMIRAVLAATLSSVYGIYSGLRALRKRSASRSRGISRLGEISVEGARLGRAGQHQGVDHAAKPDPARKPRAASLRQPSFPPGRQRAILFYSKMTRGAGQHHPRRRESRSALHSVRLRSTLRSKTSARWEPRAMKCTTS